MRKIRGSTGFRIMCIRILTDCRPMALDFLFVKQKQGIACGGFKNGGATMVLYSGTCSVGQRNQRQITSNSKYPD